VGRGPSVQFHRAHLRRADQRVDIIDLHQGCMARVQLRIQLLDVGDLQVIGVFLKEQFFADTVRCPQQRDRAQLEVRQDPRGDIQVILRQLGLLHAADTVDDPLGVGDRHPVDFGGTGFFATLGFWCGGLYRQGLLPNHFVGGRMGRQAEENSLPHLAIAGPLSELDLTGQGRLDPLHAASLRTVERLSQWRGLALLGTQLLMQLLDLYLAEPCADPAGIHQPRCSVDGQQQRAETAALALGAGESDDDEGLAQPALELYPVGASAGHIRAAQALADHAVQ